MAGLKAPFPWFGGKSRVAKEVWDAFGDVKNYVEPFFGSGAVLLARPSEPKIETINDKDGFVANFWRAVTHAPEETARWADNPVNENDLHARHIWLVGQRNDLTRRLEGDPDYFDAKIAGWWVWGICCWIAGGWCSGKGPWQSLNGKLVSVSTVGNGLRRQLPHLGDAGVGVNRQLPHLSANRGVNRKLPHIGDDGRGVNKGGVYDWFDALEHRLRDVRVCCGDWSRICGPSPTFKNGLTGVFLDPPYSADAGRDEVYSQEDFAVAHAVRDWCLANGANKLLRIALCGYEGDHNELQRCGWRVHEWKARGGYGSQGSGRGRDNAGRERIWFSPHCLAPDQRGLFDAVA